jgi:hypothetical protein
MKKLLSLLMLVFCSVVHADWRMVTIYSKYIPAGYIYYTSAIGSVDKEKVNTRLQFICSLKGGDPIVSVFWEKNIEAGSEVTLSVATDNSIPINYTWAVDGELILSPLLSSHKLINTIKSGKIVKFKMQGTKVAYLTAFNVSGVDFTEFNTMCSTNV